MEILSADCKNHQVAAQISVSPERLAHFKNLLSTSSFGDVPGETDWEENPGAAAEEIPHERL